MTRSLGFAAALAFGLFTFAPVAASAAPACPPVIDVGEFYVDGVLDLDAYLAALASATAACNASMPGTGADMTPFTSIGVGLASVGTVAVISARRRRSSRIA